MITGSHVIVYSRDAAADANAFFADVLGDPHVDAGGVAKMADLRRCRPQSWPSTRPMVRPGMELYFM